jgi:hypothetical protein
VLGFDIVSNARIGMGPRLGVGIVLLVPRLKGTADIILWVGVILDFMTFANSVLRIPIILQLVWARIALLPKPSIFCGV